MMEPWFNLQPCYVCLFSDKTAPRIIEFEPLIKGNSVSVSVLSMDDPAMGVSLNNATNKQTQR